MYDAISIKVGVKDVWQRFPYKNGQGAVWQRTRHKQRGAMFTPKGTDNTRPDWTTLHPVRKTIVHFVDGTNQALVDDWTKQFPHSVLDNHWTGFTQFFEKGGLPRAGYERVRCRTPLYHPTYPGQTPGELVANEEAPQNAPPNSK